MNPRLLVIAGPNGSGKTSITEQLHELRHKWMLGCDYINPDTIAETCFSGWNDPSAIRLAAQKAEALRYDCLTHGRDFAFETVFSTQAKVDFLKEAKRQGYFIRFFFVGTDSPEINAARVTKRYINGGHAVPIEKIVARYSRSMANALEAATFVDRAYFYDNSTEFIEGNIPDWTPLFRTQDGRLCEKYPRPTHHPWAQEIYDGLKRHTLKDQVF